VDPGTRETQEKSHLFDRAATKVCRRCTHYSLCWDRESQETFRLLRPVLATVMERGEARREDFPEEFSQRCRHLEGLVVAINQELEDIACRNQCRSRNQEHRLIVSRTLLHMSRMLEKNARQLRGCQRVPEEAFDARLGVAAKGRRGARISGDRGISLHTQEGYLYVILCDGMGTGDPAAQESVLAVETLGALIQGGMPPDSAMELLSGMYILRDSGGFATMDILELSLLSGQGTLYKWGAAPSYVKSGNVLKKLGTAAPPPGLGMGRENGPEVLRLNLWGGDLLILISDGVLCQETELLLQDFEGENIKALANQLVDTAAKVSGEDDMTAAVVQLRALHP
jgi:stage II sporulation protein E